MSGIARLLLSSGAKVSGSDLKRTRIIEELEKQGAIIFIGHHAANIKGADKVIYSSAIKEDNPEIQEAKKQKTPLFKRAQALAELMQDKTVITVTGSHGKTTTTSLVAYLLMEAGLFPSVAIGGILRNIENNACLGQGELFVAEADESDGSFLYYRPKYSIITNIDYEHLDYYKDFQNEINAFKEFIQRTDKDGCVFCCSDDKNIREIIKNYKAKYILFGLHDADIYPENIRMDGLSCEFNCIYKNKFIARFYLALGGMHNISNALAVIALGLELGISVEVIKKALANYKGAGRRIEIKFQNKDYLVIDDYAHHPTEIKATLSAIRNLKFKKAVAIFQPHRYSRTKLLLDEFAKCFDLADEVVITDIYPANEQPIEGITGERLKDKIKEHSPDKQVVFIPKADIVNYAAAAVKAGDLIITLGAGDITKICDELVERIKR